MFAKVYSQIFDSSIAEDHQVRHCFMDLLVLSDQDGVVDMTMEAIARRTNVPIEQVRRCIDELCKPDSRSRSHEESGARIKLIDSHRDWGWQIINYAHYRELRDEESRRTYFRDNKRKQRAKAKEVSKMSTGVQKRPRPSTVVTHTEAEAEAEAEAKKRYISPSREQVELLMAKAGLPPSEAEKFWCFYESKGWKVGKGRMVSVAGAVGGWAARYREALQLFKDQPQGVNSTAQAIIHQKELDAVQAKMDAIRNSYSEHQTMTREDYDRFNQHKSRKIELKKLLGMQV